MSYPKSSACVLVLVALVTSACTTRVAVRKNLASPPAAAAKLPARVVLVEAAPPAPSEIKRGGDHTSIVALQPGLSHAVGAMLEGAFGEFSRAPGAEAAPAADFLAEYRIINAAYQEQFVLELREPGETPRFRKAWQVLDKTPAGNKFIGMLSYIPPMYFLMPLSSASKAMRTRDELEKQLLKGLEEFSAELRRDFPAFRKDKALAEAGEAKGDSLAAADPGGALSAYQGAYAAAGPHRSGGRRVLAKIVALVSRSGAPTADETAKEAMARGKAFIARAASPADFRPAVEAMDGAVMAAPAWAAGHFNTALAHEGAGDWPAAGEHFEAYLALKPAAADRDEVLKKIAELKVRGELGDKPMGR
ncbi:MAG: hypothetical protein HYZ75_14795 [Elusimicrobia bacterium]|nr:hypothetical protein [Elusimicrobiota bacterium]